jgi:peptide/nickel transport system substrate-binding protein
MIRIGKRLKSRRRGAVFCCTVYFCVILSNPGCKRASKEEQHVSSGPITLTIGWPFISGQDSMNGIQQATPLLSNEGLVLIGRDGRPQPRLAQAWTESGDGLTWTIQLRPNAVFHDGTPVDSAAVKASLERTRSSPSRTFSPGLLDIVSIETPAPTQVVIRLSRRSTFLLDDLSVAITKRDASGKLVATGPYFTSFTSPTEVVMTAFPSYYRGSPTIDRVVWKSYSTARTSWAAMMRGEIDFLYEVSPDALDFMRKEASVKEFSFLRNYVHAVIFNSKRPIFRDARVRRALNYAVDRAAIITQVFKGHGVPAQTPTWPQHWASDTQVPTYAYDPARAAALLDAAGLTYEQRQNSNRPPARLHFTCIFASSFPLWERMGLLVQRELSQIGVDMQLETLPLEEFNKRAGTGDFDAALADRPAGNAAGRPYVFWYSSSPQNVVGYSNPEVDAAFDRLKEAADENATRAAFRDLQMYLMDDPPGMFLVFSEATRAVSRRFDPVEPPGGDIFRTISEWRLAETPVTRRRDSN